jgi:PAS domain S-box-containing protein
VSCNKAYEWEFGTTSEHLKGKTVLDLEYLPEEERRRFHEEDMAVIREVSRRSYELPITFADGETHITMYSVDGFNLSDGNPGGLIGLMVDITDQKRAEEELRKAGFLSDMALELTKCGYWQIDYDDPDYYYQSERAARIVGEEIKPDGRYHLQDEWFSRLVEADPEIAQEVTEKYQGAIDGTYANYNAIYPYKRPLDGRIVWLHAAGSVVRGDDGRARYMYGVYQDITQQNRAEAALAESEHRIRRILETANEGFWFVDNATVTLAANPAMCSILGRPQEEIIGRKIFDFVDEENRRIFEAQLEERKKGKSGAYEISLQRPDGTNIP